MERKNENEKWMVSIIIPCYNAEDTLERCLKSVTNQNYQNLEILVVEDGSQDGSRKIVQEFAETDRRIQMISQGHNGVSGARNLGLKYATGRYIQFVDSDDFIEKSCTERLVQSMEREHADWVICSYRQDNECGEEYKHLHKCMEDGVYEKRKFIKKFSRCPGAHYYGVLWNKLYRTEFIRNNNLSFRVDVSMGEDFIFNMQYLSLVKKVCCIEDKLYIYQWGRQNSLSNIEKEEAVRIEERVSMYNAYVNLFQSEGMHRRCRWMMQYYILKFYYDELEHLGHYAEKYRLLLYQKCIRETGITAAEFQMYRFLKTGKRFVNCMNHRIRNK